MKKKFHKNTTYESNEGDRGRRKKNRSCTHIHGILLISEWKPVYSEEVIEMSVRSTAKPNKNPVNTGKGRLYSVLATGFNNGNGAGFVLEAAVDAGNKRYEKHSDGYGNYLIKVYDIVDHFGRPASPRLVRVEYYIQGKLESFAIYSGEAGQEVVVLREKATGNEMFPQPNWG